jgi:hypothetical protein
MGNTTQQVADDRTISAGIVTFRRSACVVSVTSRCSDAWFADVVGRAGERRARVSRSGCGKEERQVAARQKNSRWRSAAVVVCKSWKPAAVSAACRSWGS